MREKKTKTFILAAVISHCIFLAIGAVATVTLGMYYLELDERVQKLEMLDK